MKMNPRERKEQSFTLIELLVVIAILAVLAVAVTLILNPAELIRQGRDSTRLSDLAIINRALGLYQTDQIAKWMGTSTVVYTSLPDTTSTCASYGLPSLPSGWEYHCVQSSSSTRVNGTGWLPVDFTSMSFSSPLSRLPLDPVNNATTSKYYTYVSGGSWKLSAVFESETRAADAADDGGTDLATYEIGTDLELAPFIHGLVGYYKFNGSSTSAVDSSGYSRDEPMYSSSTITDLHTSSGCKKNKCVSFDGTDDYIELTDSFFTNLGTSGDFTISIWFKTSSAGEGFASWYGDHGNGRFVVRANLVSLYDGSSYRQVFLSGIRDNNWHYVVGVFDRTNGSIIAYIDGSKYGDVSWNGNIESTGYSDQQKIGCKKTKNLSCANFYSGSIDDIRIYERALSAAEIEAMYNSY